MDMLSAAVLGIILIYWTAGATVCVSLIVLAKRGAEKLVWRLHGLGVTSTFSLSCGIS